MAEDECHVDDQAGDELDYMTDSSSNEEELSAEELEQIYQVVGVEEEAGLRTLLIDSSDSEEEQVKMKADEGGMYGKIREVKSNMLMPRAIIPISQHLGPLLVRFHLHHHHCRCPPIQIRMKKRMTVLGKSWKLKWNQNYNNRFPN